MLLLSPGLTTLSLAIAAVSIIFTLYLWTVRYTKKEKVGGALRLIEKPIDVLSMDNGTLRELLIKTDQIVKKNELIAIIDTEPVQIGGRKLSDLQEEEAGNSRRKIEAQILRLSEKRDIALSKARSDTSKIENDMKAGERIIAEYKINGEKIKTRIKNVKELYRKRIITRTEYDSLISEYRANKERLIRERRANDALRADLPAIEREKTISLKAVDEEKLALEKQMDELRKQLSETKSRKGVEMRAPVDGKIGTLELRPGASVSSGMPIATILPMVQNYEAEIYVPSTIMPFLKQGQNVWLTLDGFPAQTYGLFPGKIESTASVQMSGAERQKLEIDKPSFLVKIALSKQKISRMDDEFELKDGIRLTADIPLTTRRLWDWVAEPLKRLQKSSEVQ